MAQTSQGPALNGARQTVSSTCDTHTESAARSQASSRASDTPIELTLFTKLEGILSKRIKLAADGAVLSDGSECRMSSGRAQRVTVDGAAGLAALIEELGSDQAITLGALRSDQRDDVEVTTRKKHNGAAPGVITRTQEYICYAAGRPAFVLLDFDAKGMPAEVATKLNDDFWAALISVCPGLRGAARVTRRSTSAGLRRADTGAELPGAGGVHIYVVARDGTDVERFLKTLYDRAWLAEFGWIMIGAAGQLLERSIVDRAVRTPERLVFEAPPVLEPPLEQDAERRRPVSVAGEVVDTVLACPPLTADEQQAVDKLKRAAIRQAQPAADKARADYVEANARVLAERTGMPFDAARRVIEHQTKGLLLADVALEFVDKDLAGSTVGDVLNAPERFKGRTLADPIEGVEYGRTTAMVMVRDDGTPWIKSFAHGGTVYALAREAAGEEHAAAGNNSQPPPGDDACATEEAASTKVVTINNDYALVLSGNKASIMKLDEAGNFRLLQVNAFRQWFSNQYIPIGKKVMTIAEYWLGHPQRRQYEGIEFDPGGGRKGYYNLWRGFAVEAREGDCSKFLAHLRDNVAQHDEQLFRWVVGWFAQIIQQPTMKLGTSLTLRGKMGTGKTKVGEIVGSFLGANHYALVADPRFVTGQFNSHMASLLLLQADEAFWAGDKRGEGKLRDLITGKVHYLEYKGVDPIQVRNLIRLFVTGNPDWTVPAGFEERRFAVLDVGEEHMQDLQYFAAIDDEMNNGGREALLHYLLHFDLSTVDPRVIPMTAALLEQKIASATPEQAWWLDTLKSGKLPYGTAEPRTCIKTRLFHSYIRHARLQGANRRAIETVIGMFLNKVVPGLIGDIKLTYDVYEQGRWETKRGAAYRFPPLAECRDRFARALQQGIAWSGGNDEWEHDDEHVDQDDLPL